MKFSMFTKHGALIVPDIFNAIRQGLTKLGHIVTENEMDCDISNLSSAVEWQNDA